MISDERERFDIRSFIGKSEGSLSLMSSGLPRLIWETRRTLKRRPAAIADRQCARLARMVAFARGNSPYYAELYRELPAHVADPRLLPVTSKTKLMARFDDWATDRAVTLDEAGAFVEDARLIGEPFLGRYTAVTTSGTTGTPGIFLYDAGAMGVVGALAFRMLSEWLDAGDVMRLIAGGGRMSMVMAQGGHFASAVAAKRLQKSGRWRAKRTQVLSVHRPLADIVAELNRFQPAIVAPYASLAALLADEQEAGRLRIHPVLMALSAEGLPLQGYGRIAQVFRTKVGNSYAASECPFLSYGCREGWLHVNADWAILEPVDTDYRPTPPGEYSHTILLTNLANRVLPILRYDLGDSVMQRPEPCPCGNPLPAIRVQGRAADAVTFVTKGGVQVTIPPLAFETIAHRPGVDLFQIVQDAPERLLVRFRTAAGVQAAHIWPPMRADLERLLTERDLGHIAVDRATEPPEQSAGGKYRRVVRL